MRGELESADRHWGPKGLPSAPGDPFLRCDISERYQFASWGPMLTSRGEAGWKPMFQGFGGSTGRWMVDGEEAALTLLFVFRLRLFIIF